MDGRVRDRVADWSERPVEGVDGVCDLADRQFSGVVEHATGTAWFAMLNGRILGVHDGRIEDFEGARATARSAPEPGVALLVAMLAADADPEDRYYTEDTPVSQAHETLSAGGFVGFLELSENVLSGDYYVAYYGDRSMPVAFVGNSDRLVTGDEALERADDEVGIYHVYAVDVETVDLPRDTTTETAPATDAASGDGSDPGPDSVRDPEAAGFGEGGSSVDAGADGRDTPGGDTAGVQGADPATGGTEGGADGAGTPTPTPTPADGSSSSGDAADEQRDASERHSRETEYGSSTGLDGRTGRRRTSTTREFDDGADDGTDGVGGHDTRDQDLDWDRERGGDETAAEPGAGRGATVGDTERDTSDGRPGETTADDVPGRPGSNEAEAGTSREGRGETGRDTTAPAGPEDGDDGRETGSHASSGGAGREGHPEAAAAPAELREQVETHERRIEQLRDRAASLESAGERAAEDRQAIRTELEEVAADLSDLRRTVVRLDRTVDRMTADGGPNGAGVTDDTAGDTDPTDDGGARSNDMTAETALAETTLLLRYGSRSEPTLETAHDDAEVDRAAVEENLRVDVHTPFDDAGATVDGESHRAFIEHRIEYRFFEWLARDLLFEIRETGAQGALRDLYDALPSIDRAELRSTIAVDHEDEETEREDATFDVVVRDAHERPLVVARLNPTRDPATEESIVGLRDSANVVGEHTDLAAAFSVTESYFSGSARDAAEEATADSILSRNARESYVKLSRKRGYHLCLVAVGSDEAFHLRVPDL